MKCKVIAVTGGIGSGKSAVGAYLRSKGYVTVDCDSLSREVAGQPQVIAEVKSLLGDGCVKDGILDRKAIREVIFTDEKLHQAYSQLFYDGVKRLLLDFVEDRQGVVFVEIPVFDAFEFSWSGVWLVERNLQKRVASVAERDNVSHQNVLDVISKQTICQSYTVKFVNDGSLQQLYNQVDLALATLNLS